MADETSNGIGWLGHATTLIQVDGVALLTDPLLHRRTAHLRRVAAPLPAELPAITAVLLSHVHWDHLDLRSLRRVGTGVRMIVPRGVAKLLTRKGFADVVEIDEGDELRLGDVVVRATHADHDADRGPLGTHAPSLGFLVSGTQRVYFAGDTDVFDDMALLADDLDVALLPVAGWGPDRPRRAHGRGARRRGITSAAAADRDPDPLGDAGAALSPHAVRLGRGGTIRRPGEARRTRGRRAGPGCRRDDAVHGVRRRFTRRRRRACLAVAPATGGDPTRRPRGRR